MLRRRACAGVRGRPARACGWTAGGRRQRRPEMDDRHAGSPAYRTRLTGRLVRPTSPDRARRGRFRRSEALSRVRRHVGPLPPVRLSITDSVTSVCDIDVADASLGAASLPITLRSHPSVVGPGSFRRRFLPCARLGGALPAARRITCPDALRAFTRARAQVVLGRGRRVGASRRGTRGATHDGSDAMVGAARRSHDRDADGSSVGAFVMTSAAMTATAQSERRIWSRAGTGCQSPHRRPLRPAGHE